MGLNDGVSGEGQNDEIVVDGRRNANVIEKASSVDDKATDGVHDPGKHAQTEGHDQRGQNVVQMVGMECTDRKFVFLTEQQLNIILHQFGAEACEEAKHDCEYGHMLLAEYNKYIQDQKLKRQKDLEMKRNRAKEQIGILDQRVAKEREEKIREQERIDAECREAERKKAEEQERMQKLQKDKEEEYYKKVENELRAKLQKEKEEREMKDLDEKIRPGLESQLRKELGIIKKEVYQSPSGSQELVPVLLNEMKVETTGSRYSEHQTKRTLDMDVMCTPPGKKIRSYEDFKSLVSPGKGKPKSQKQIAAKISLFGSPRTRSLAQKEDDMMSLAEMKTNLMRSLDKFLIAKAPKDKDKKVLFEKLSSLGLCIDENSLRVNKNIGSDTFYLAMTSYFPDLGVFVQGNIAKLRCIVSRYVSSELLNFTEVNIK